MAKNWKRFALALWVLALCIGTMGVDVFAAVPVTAQIPVRITLVGTEPAVLEPFVVEMTAADPAYPMPTGAENGVYRMALAGKSSETIEIAFHTPGVYDYTVRQLPGTNGDCDYDDSVYHVTAHVTKSGTGSGCDLTVVVYRSGETGKQADITFENVYAIETTPESPQTGDDVPIGWWSTLLVLSLISSAALVIPRRKPTN